MGKSRNQALIERCKRGDRRALEELVGIYEKPVFNAAYRILGNPDDAADVTQAAFLKAFVNLQRFDPNHRFFSWIYRIAVNESINQLKRSGKHQVLDDKRAAPTRSPDRTAEASGLEHAVQEGLMTLTDDYRAVVVLRHFSDCSYRQISDILQIPEKTVKSRLYSARQRLKEEFEAMGVG